MKNITIVSQVGSNLLASHGRFGLSVTERVGTFDKSLVVRRNGNVSTLLSVTLYLISSLVKKDIKIKT